MRLEGDFGSPGTYITRGRCARKVFRRGLSLLRLSSEGAQDVNHSTGPPGREAPARRFARAGESLSAISLCSIDWNTVWVCCCFYRARALVAHARCFVA